MNCQVDTFRSDSRRSLNLIVAFGIVVAASADSVRLVRDITQDGPSESSFPRRFVAAGNRAVFVANQPQTGAELWSTDGTPEGTLFLGDLTPGLTGTFSSSFQSRSILFPLGANVFFRGPSAALWKTDGTPQGTALVSSAVAPESFISSNNDADRNPVYADLNGVLIFAGTDAGADRELWRSDGTAEGTWRIRDINQGSASSNPQQMCVAAGRVFFAADDGSSGSELWSTDGTESGTVRISDINPGTSSSAPRFLCALDDQFLFSADSAATGAELWISDGTEVGTNIFADIRPGASGSDPREMVRIGDLVYFSADNGVIGRELWRTDGESAPVSTDVRPGSGSGLTIVSWLTNVEGVLYFTSWCDLFRTTSTPGVLQNLGNPPGDGLCIGQLRAFGSAVFFSVESDDYGVELWRARNGVSGLSLLRDILPGPVGGMAYPAIYENVLGRLLICAEDGEHGFELWQSDGTTEGTAFLADPSPGRNSSNPIDLAFSGDMLLFQASDRTIGTELWRSDGTAVGTQLVLDARPGGDSLDIQEVFDPHMRPAVAADGGYFYVYGDSTGDEIWTSDGTPAGTHITRSLLTLYGAFFDPLMAVGDMVYFPAMTFQYGSELWVTDGTADGTVPVRDIVPGGGSSSPQMVGSIGGLAFFHASTSSSGRELWLTDGTESGTTMLADLNPGAASGAFLSMTAGNVADGRLVFPALVPPSGIEPWITDGTAEGTHQLAEIAAGTLNANPSNFALVDGWLYFSAIEADGVRRLWRTDGSPEGTQRVERAAGVRSPNAAVRLANGIAFSALSDTVGRELWYLPDGGDLVLLRDIYPGPTSSSPTSLTSVCGRVYFVADDSVHGLELWLSDGTVAGTELLVDLYPGFGSAAPRELTARGNRIFFSAETPELGRELWIVEVFLPGDFDRDGDVDLADLAVELSDFGCDSTSGPCAGDLNGDSQTNLADLAVVLSSFGRTCP